MVAPQREEPGRQRIPSGHVEVPGKERNGGFGPMARRVIMAVCILALAAALILTIWFTMWVWLVLFAGILLAVFLRALTIGVRYVTRLPDGWALTVTCVLLVALTAGAFALLAPRVTEQVGELRVTLPEALEALAEHVRQFAWGDFLIRQLERVDLEEFQPMLAAGAATVVQNVLTAIIAVLVVIFLGVYFAAQPRLYIEGVARLFTKPLRPRIREVMHKTGETLMWWLLGRIVAMAFVGVTVALGLWALGVPLSFTLGLIAGILDFIPNIGPFLAAAPAVLLAFAESPQLALYVVILYFVIQQLESYVVTPIVQHKVVHLPPALTVFVQVLAFVIAGILGLLLATPLAAAGLVIIKEMYVKDTLGDEIEEDEEPRDRRPTIERMREAKAAAGH